LHANVLVIYEADRMWPVPLSGQKVVILNCQFVSKALRLNTLNYGIS